VRAPSLLPWLAFLLAAAPLASAQNCNNTSVGFTPLIDFAPGQLYQGQPGGLYPGAQNAPPIAHLQGGLTEAAQIVPRDSQGNPAVFGKIGLAVIGMSNAQIEGIAFVPLAQASPQMNPYVVPVNAAFKSQDAVLLADPNAWYWTYVDSQVSAAGLVNAQVQAVWLKEAIANVALPFPQDANLYYTYLRSIVVNLKAKFPNLHACYISSRCYGGYSTTGLSPEPYAYQTAFAVRSLITAQINGDPLLNYDPNIGAVRAPWCAWGPYLWADGIIPRSDGLTWICSDFLPDGTHPSPQGGAKVANLLLGFLLSDPTSSIWFVKPACPTPASTAPFGSGLAGALGEPLLTSTLPKLGSAAWSLDASAVGAGAIVYLGLGSAGYPDGAMPFAGGWLHTSAEIVVFLPADGAGIANFPFGGIPDHPALYGLQLFAQVAAVDPTAPQGYALSQGLQITIGS
jgi:hypothetical protein